ncbi:MAG: nicotinate-nucleotide adenylyltransferase [Desulfobacteraceae bacterium]
MKSGLFGGTFNPLHTGHIDTLRVVRDNFGLDRVYLIPCSVPPHKPAAGLAPAADRLEMINRSIRDIKGFYSSGMELERGGPSYTIDTVLEFKKEYADTTRPHLIIGSDAFFDITTWDRYQKIFDEIDVIVMTRPGYRDTLAEITSFVRQGISPGYCFRDEENAFVHNGEKKKIHIAEVPLIDISSTMIRELVRKGEPFGHLVPLPVKKIIVEKGLYS